MTSLQLTGGVVGTLNPPDTGPIRSAPWCLVDTTTTYILSTNPTNVTGTPATGWQHYIWFTGGGTNLWSTNTQNTSPPVPGLIPGLGSVSPLSYTWANDKYYMMRRVFTLTAAEAAAANVMTLRLYCDRTAVAVTVNGHMVYETNPIPGVNGYGHDMAAPGLGIGSVSPTITINAPVWVAGTNAVQFYIYNDTVTPNTHTVAFPTIAALVAEIILKIGTLNTTWYNLVDRFGVETWYDPVTGTEQATAPVPTASQTFTPCPCTFTVPSLGYRYVVNCV